MTVHDEELPAYPAPEVGDTTMPYPLTSAETLISPDQANVVGAILMSTAAVVLYQPGQEPVSIDMRDRRDRSGPDGPPESVLLRRWADGMAGPIQTVATRLPYSIGGKQHLLDTRRVTSRDSQVACTFINGLSPPTFLLLGMPTVYADAFAGMVRVTPQAYKAVVSAELQRLGQDPAAWERGYPSDGVAVVWRSARNTPSDKPGWDGALEYLEPGIVPGQEAVARKRMRGTAAPLNYGKHPVIRPGDKGYSEVGKYYEVSEWHSVREGVSPANIERVEAIARTGVVGLGFYGKSPYGTVLRSSRGDLKFTDNRLRESSAYHGVFVNQDGEHNWSNFFNNIGMDTTLDYLKEVGEITPDGRGLGPQDNHVLIRDDASNTLILAAKSDQQFSGESRSRSWQVVGVQLEEDAYWDMIRMITEQNQPNSLRLLLFQGLYETFKIQSYGDNPGIETLPTDGLIITTPDEIQSMHQLWESERSSAYQSPAWPHLHKIGYPQRQRLLVSQSSRNTRR